MYKRKRSITKLLYSITNITIDSYYYHYKYYVVKKTDNIIISIKENKTPVFHEYRVFILFTFLLQFNGIKGKYILIRII